MVGCYECARRRIHCDRKEPRCNKCIARGLNCSGIPPKYKFINSPFSEISQSSRPERGQQSGRGRSQQVSTFTSQGPLKHFHGGPRDLREVNDPSTYTSSRIGSKNLTSGPFPLVGNQERTGTEAQNGELDSLLQMETPNQLSLLTALTEDPWANLFNEDMSIQFGKSKLCHIPPWYKSRFTKAVQTKSIHPRTTTVTNIVGPYEGSWRGSSAKFNKPS